jgi:hypothetical protein
VLAACEKRKLQALRAAAIRLAIDVDDLAALNDAIACSGSSMAASARCRPM